ncbi:tail assembly chaperone [Gordonia Phage JonJames]|nr:tail assembly chaperone [Gordonia Phage JonJames]
MSKKDTTKVAEDKSEDTLDESVLTEEDFDLEAAPDSRWLSILEDALEDYKRGDSYFFDGFGPKNIIEITPPDTAERALAIINLNDLKGSVELRDVKPYLQALLGDSFEIIWKYKLSRLPVEVSIAFALELQEHFFGAGTIDKIKANGADKLPGGLPGLVELLEAYYEPLTQDLADRGIDLLDWVRGKRPWPQLYVIIKGFRQGHSRYLDVINRDMKFAEGIVAAQKMMEEAQRDEMIRTGIAPPEDPEEEPRDTPTSNFGWDTNAELQAQTIDAIKVLNATLIAVNTAKGKKPPKVRPTSRPVSAMEAVRRRMDREEAQSALKQLGFNL